MTPLSDQQSSASPFGCLYALPPIKLLLSAQSDIDQALQHICTTTSDGDTAALQQLCCALYLADLLCLCAKKVAFGCLVYAELWWLQEDAEEKQGQHGNYTDRGGSPNGFGNVSAVG